MAAPGMGDAALRAQGLFALEGAFLIERAVKAGVEITSLYCVTSRLDWARSIAIPPSSIIPLPEREISSIAGYPFHRGAYALARREGERPLRELLEALRPGPGATILVAPEAIDPENVGSLFRNAAALGADALLLGPKSPDPLDRKALRVSMGTALALPWARLAGPEELEDLVQSGFELAAAVLGEGAVEAGSWDRPGRLALLVGNEAFGLSPPWLGPCRTRLTIPMSSGTDSLNVSTAAALLLYILRKG
jgi:tRNA G18 (ribose-2'-O)-methylase SpoU